MFNMFIPYHSLDFASTTRLRGWGELFQLYSSLDLAAEVSFYGPTFCTSKDWIVLAGILFNRLNIYVHIYSSMGWTKVLMASSCPLFGRIRLEPAFLCFAFRKAYRRYIFASREFTRLRLLAFLWVNLNKNNMEIRNSHSIMYIT